MADPVPDDPAGPRAEVLDTGSGRAWSPARRRAVLVVVLLALLTSTVAVLVDRTAPASAPRPAPSDSPAGPPTASARPSPGAPVVLRRTGPVPAGLGGGTLFVRSAETVFRIDLDTGRVTATPAPVPTPALVSFVAGPFGVVVRPADRNQGWLVPDDGAARELRGLLATAAQVLPATRGRLWTGGQRDGRDTIFVLTSSDGTPTRASVRENGYFLPDRTGGLLLVDAGGLWERVRGSWRKVALGTALGTGPRQHLLATCAGTDSCGVVQLVRYDRASRTSETVLEDTDLQLPGGGTLSADGRYLASMSADDLGAGGQGRALVLDLDTGRVVKQMVVRAPSVDVSGVAVWGPGGDRLVGVDDGQLFVLDPTTGTTTRPDLGLPSGSTVEQVALRPSPAR